MSWLRAGRAGSVGEDRPADRITPTLILKDEPSDLFGKSVPLPVTFGPSRMSIVGPRAADGFDGICRCAKIVFGHMPDACCLSCRIGQRTALLPSAGGQPPSHALRLPEPASSPCGRPPIHGRRLWHRVGVGLLASCSRRGAARARHSRPPRVRAAGGRRLSACLRGGWSPSPGLVLRGGSWLTTRHDRRSQRRSIRPPAADGGPDRLRRRVRADERYAARR